MWLQILRPALGYYCRNTLVLILRSVTCSGWKFFCSRKMPYALQFKTLAVGKLGKPANVVTCKIINMDRPCEELPKMGSPCGGNYTVENNGSCRKNEITERLWLKILKTDSNNWFWLGSQWKLKDWKNKTKKSQLKFDIMLESHPNGNHLRCTYEKRWRWLFDKHWERKMRLVTIYLEAKKKQQRSVISCKH